ncbi:MAG: transcriptional regulator [Bacteroidetes bacterium]|nr:transcriptional regulator [Bacteroidota bacterium]
MEIKPIKTNKQYETYMTWVDAQFEKGVKKNTTLGNQLEIVLMLIQKYEDEKFPIPTPDAIEAIKLKMQERGIRNQDLVGEIGNKSYVSSILNKRKPLTLEIAKYFHHKLGIPAAVLLA